MLYTDIAAELYGAQRGSVPKGVKIFTASAGGVNLTRVDILRAGLRRPKGCYITLDVPSLAHIDTRDEAFVLAIASQLRALLPPSGAVLVAGIGNRAVIADALGPATADKIFVTPAHTAHGADDIPLRAVAAMSPGVEGCTGLATLDVLRGLVAAWAPAAVLCVDSLCTRTPARLGHSVQLSTAGLCPRAGADGASRIDSEALGVPVVAIGVPTVTEVEQKGCSALLMTPKDVDAMVRRGADLLALAVNKALQPALRVGELSFLTS